MNPKTRTPFTRRDFLQSVGGGIALLAISPIARAADPRSPKSEEEMLRILSGESAYAPLPGHLHTLEIPMTIFQDPPADGVKLKTTWAYGHLHFIPLTQEEIQFIADGHAVLAEDTNGDHLYDISLSKGVPEENY